MDVKIIFVALLLLWLFSGPISNVLSDSRVASGNPTINDINKNIINYDGKTVTTEGFYFTSGRDMDKQFLTLNEGINSGSNSYLKVVAPYGDSRFNVLSTVSCKLSTPLYRVTGVIRVVWSGGSSSSPSEISMDPTSVEFVRCQKLY